MWYVSNLIAPSPITFDFKVISTVKCAWKSLQPTLPVSDRKYGRSNKKWPYRWPWLTFECRFRNYDISKTVHDRHVVVIDDVVCFLSNSAITNDPEWCSERVVLRQPSFLYVIGLGGGKWQSSTAMSGPVSVYVTQSAHSVATALPSCIAPALEKYYKMFPELAGGNRPQKGLRWE